MSEIDFLERGHGAAFRVRMSDDQGDDLFVDLPDPRTQHYQWVLTCLALKTVPGIPNMPDWQHSLVFERWCAAWQLPPFTAARRLAYLVDHYRAPISSDLHTHANLDLGDLWRDRRWLTLIDVIDRLPAHSWYASAVANDEEHAQMLAAQLAARSAAGDEAKESGPALTTWTPEVAVMTSVLDAVRHLAYATVAVQGGSSGEPPKPAPRPSTAIEKAMKAADNARRKSKHDKLVARVLPNRTPGESPVH